MQIHNNEITIYRNETFTMNKVITNRDGSPYIVSSELVNPYFLITVTDSLYKQNNNFIYNKWLKLKDTLRFRITRPVTLKELGFSSFNGFRLQPGYEGDESMGYANVAVFTDGKEYKYWSYDTNSWQDYTCEIHTSFSSRVTSQWPEQTNYYGILLVSGESTEDYLRTTCDELGLDSNQDIGSMFNAIQDVSPALVSHITAPGRPIISFDEVREILEPTRLYVKSNLKGAMI